MKSRVVLACLLSSVLWLGGCGGSANNKTSDSSSVDSSASGSDSQDDAAEDDCGGWTKSKPAPQNEVITCGDWSVSISAAVFMPDSLILAANSLNEVPKPGGKTVAIRLKATYNGTGTGDIRDVFGNGGGLIGLKNTRYEEDTPCCEEDWDGWRWEDDPYEGGTVEGNLFFITESGDGDFILALDFDAYDEVKAWISVDPLEGEDL